MPKSLQVHIEKPCSADWNSMTEMGKGRFCGTCQKQVVDFTLMSDAEIFQYISKTEHQLCGRFGNDQLDRNIPAGKTRKLGWFRYFIQVMIPALILVNKSQALEMRKPTQENINLLPVQGNVKKITDTNWIDKETVFRGRVVDKEQNGIPNATIAIKGTYHAVISNDDGGFAINVKNPEDTFLVISCLGFKTVRRVIENISDRQTGVKTIALEWDFGNATTGTVIIVETTKPAKISRCQGWLQLPPLMASKTIK